MKTLSIFSVVKDEEVMIEDMLRSARGADEHVIIDTGSTDRTIEICKKYTDKVFTDYVWDDNFSEAKNYGISKCTGDWIVSLDADCRFKEGSIETIKEFIQTADKNMYRLPLIWNDSNNKPHHWLPKLYRREANVQYIGRVHEYPSILAEGDVNAPIVFLYSPNHAKNPDRNINYLLKDDLTKPRNQFYLGREYFERRRYEEAIKWLARYVESNSWLPERAEGLLTLAKCYWFTDNGEKAREAAFRAFRLNPEFKEAAKMLSEMHFEPWKSKWTKIANQCDNTDVLFIRT